MGLRAGSAEWRAFRRFPAARGLHGLPRDESWVVLSPIEASIKRKIEAVGTPLREWDISINYGIKTGCNEAFIIPTSRRDEILAACRDEAERERTAALIRPILRGKDIKRYGYKWAELWVIATFPSRHYDIDSYPAVRDYLLSFGRERLEQTGATYRRDGMEIKARKKTNNQWFETQDSISYWEDFDEHKIIYPNMTKFLPFYYDVEGFLTNQKMLHHHGQVPCFPNSFLQLLAVQIVLSRQFPRVVGRHSRTKQSLFRQDPRFSGG